MAMRAAHPSVVECYGVGQDQNGDICIVTEFLEGGDLRDLILNEQKYKKVNDVDLFKILD